MYRPPVPRQLDLKRRGASLGLSLAAVGLMIWALVVLGVVPAPEFAPDPPNSFTLSPDPVAGPEPTPDRAERRAAAPRAAEKARVEPVRPPRPRPPTAPVAPAPLPDMLILTRDQFAASDIAGKRGAGDDRSGADAGAGGGDSAAAYGPGEGPGGQRLFNAEWRREPSDAELAGYLPPSGAPPGAWAVIACRTIERFEVDNCRALGESPVGSGLARAMRQAAWQFRVRPPRVGGKTQVGAWVRIRITFGERR